MDEVRPAYGGRCFADIPGAVVRLLTGDGEGGLDPDVLGDLDRRWTRVALVLVDAFGWSCAERHADHPFLRRVVAEGLLARLTSQFPSTTSAHMTTLHTGLPVGETGIYEWFQLEPALDRVIAPLLFSYAGDDERETLRASDLDPATLYPATTVYERLATLGVASSAVQHAAIADTTFSRATLRGATVRPFEQGGGWAARVAAALREPGPAYVVAYVDDVDATGHVHGPASDAHVAAATGVLDTLETLAQAAAGRRRDAPPRHRRSRPDAGRPRDDGVRERGLARDRGSPSPRRGRAATRAGRIGSRPLPPRPPRPRR